MLFAVIVTIFIFAATRFAWIRYGAQPRMANPVALAVAAAFVVGFVVRPFVLGTPVADTVTSAQPQTTTAPAGAAPASSAPVRDVSALCSPRLKIVDKNTVGNLDFAGTYVGTRPQPIAGTALKKGQTLVLAGWLATPSGTAPVRAACLRVDGRVVSAAKSKYGVSRPDVAQARNASALGASGFEIDVSAANLPTGQHKVSVAGVQADGTAVPLGTEVPVNVQ